MKDYKVYAYYFPNWHIDKRNEMWHGKGWTEWRVLQYATPRFEGHIQPKVPLWGYEDESDPNVMEKKISVAKKHGIDGFIFDWYWFDDGAYRERCLHEGFLNSANTNELEFSIMWANHDSPQAHPTPRMFRSPVLKECNVTPTVFKEATDFCIKNYFCRENYSRIDGKILFSIFSLDKFVDTMGGIDATVTAIADFRKRVKQAGLGEVYLNFMDSSALFFATNKENGYPEINAIASKIGINGWSTHLNEGTEREELTYDYEKWIDTFPEIYRKKCSGYNIAYNICVSTGWDSSPRTVQSEVYESIGYPYRTILVNNTPKNFAKALKNAKKFLNSEESTSDFITINSWNEWTEGAYLEPDNQYGYGYLEMIEEILK